MVNWGFSWWLLRFTYEKATAAVVDWGFSWWLLRFSKGKPIADSTMAAASPCGVSVKYLGQSGSGAWGSPSFASMPAGQGTMV